jgi:hypothetical protein
MRARSVLPVFMAKVFAAGTLKPAQEAVAPLSVN